MNEEILDDAIEFCLSEDFSLSELTDVLDFAQLLVA
jgi:hypothetical protein